MRSDAQGMVRGDGGMDEEAVWLQHRRYLPQQDSEGRNQRHRWNSNLLPASNTPWSAKEAWNHGVLLCAFGVLRGAADPRLLQHGEPWDGDVPSVGALWNGALPKEPGGPSLGCAPLAPRHRSSSSFQSRHIPSPSGNLLFPTVSSGQQDIKALTLHPCPRRYQQEKIPSSKFLPIGPQAAENHCVGCTQRSPSLISSSK